LKEKRTRLNGKIGEAGVITECVFTVKKKGFQVVA
jgi:hypothetical protein